MFFSPMLLLAIAAVPTADTPRAGPLTLRVLCYNIHHGRGTDGRVGLRRIAEVIKAARPDLVALQEVDDRTGRTGGVDQTAELARLTGLHGAFGRQIDFEGGRYGQAILARVPVGELTLHVLPGEPDRERRLAAEARLEFEGRALSFVTTHLHHLRGDFRTRQAERLNQLFADVDRPVILAGDLNATPEGEPLAALRRHWAVATDDPTLLTYPSVGPTRQIDFVLVRPAGRFRVVERSVIAEEVASDHLPVLVVLEWLPD